MMMKANQTYLNRSGNAKNASNAEKGSVIDQPTDSRTSDLPTDIAGYGVALTRLKKKSLLSIKLRQLTCIVLQLNRKIKSRDQFYEDELEKRPGWEKTIHDAEVD